MGMFYAALAKKLEMRLAGVGFSVERGEWLLGGGILRRVSEYVIVLPLYKLLTRQT
jgi:hypothetical protein